MQRAIQRPDTHSTAHSYIADGLEASDFAQGGTCTRKSVFILTDDVRIHVDMTIVMAVGEMLTIA